MNITSSTNTTNMILFRFEYYIITWISSIIGIIFSCLSLIRYFRNNHQRTHLTYVYHFSLGFSLVLSLISTPLHTLSEYFCLNLPIVSDQYYNVLCNFDLIAYFVASAGIGYSIAYASLERTFFIFYSQNIRLTLLRQFCPFLIIFSSCSIVITLFSRLTNYPFGTLSYLLFYFESFTLQLIWFSLHVIIPFIFMFISVLFLLYRIQIHTKRIRTSLNRKLSRNKFQRILIHLSIYNMFYIVSVFPVNIYSFIRINMYTKQRLVDIIFINYLYLTLHSYPILIYCLTQIKQQHRIKFSQEQKMSPCIVITHISVATDVYQRTRL